MSMQIAMQLAVQAEIEAMRVRAQATLEDLEARADKLHERHRIAAREAERAWVQQLADWISLNDRRQQQAMQIALAASTLSTEVADVARDYSDPAIGLQGIRARIGLLGSVLALIDALATANKRVHEAQVEEADNYEMFQEAEAAIERVKALHPRKEFDGSPGEFYCDACQRTAGLWPCPTIRALEAGADDD